MASVTSTGIGEPVTFPNRRGERLFGIFHEPRGGGRRDVAIMLLSPGIKSRVAPHRLYVKMAASFVAQGYAVLRFDFHGLGDSGGEVVERYLRDLYGSIQLGRYQEDTLAAVDWLSARGFSGAIAAGLCGGAITGLLAAQHDARIVGILALGIPVMLDSTAIAPGTYMTKGQLRNLQSKYFKKLIDPAAWLRLLTLRSDVRLLVRSMLVRARPSAPATATDTASVAADNTNPHFAPALFRVLERGCPVLLAFSEGDRLHWEFEEKFASRNRARLAEFRNLVDTEIITSANHVLTFEAWQRDFLARAEGWLSARFRGVPALT